MKDLFRILNPSSTGSGFCLCVCLCISLFFPFFSGWFRGFISFFSVSVLFVFVYFLSLIILFGREIVEMTIFRLFIFTLFLFLLEVFNGPQLV